MLERNETWLIRLPNYFISALEFPYQVCFATQNNQLSRLRRRGLRKDLERSDPYILSRYLTLVLIYVRGVL